MCYVLRPNLAVLDLIIDFNYVSRHTAPRNGAGILDGKQRTYFLRLSKVGMKNVSLPSKSYDRILKLYDSISSRMIESKASVTRSLQRRYSGDLTIAGRGLSRIQTIVLISRDLY
jgi:hypothetical protein